MKNKKMYIVISILAIVCIAAIAGIIIFKTTKREEVANFTDNATDDSSKEAMVVNEENNEGENEESKTEESEASQTADTSSDTESTVQESETKEVAKKEFTVTDTTATKYVTASSLNVRSGPETSYDRIGSLKYAAEVSVTGIVDGFGWYRISYNGKVGYVKASYTSDEKPEIKEVTSSSESYATDGSVIEHVIVINTSNNTLRYYRNGYLYKSYSCATGASGTQTPTGKFSIFEKIVDRPYYKQNIPGGAANNPLGPRWMQFKSGGYAIHGTSVDSSIGKSVSHGCVRMHNSDVIELYSLVPIGTTVIVSKSGGSSDQAIAAGYGVALY